ncbi:MAG: Crp/Fnr family transcriptional regulator [Methylophilaceae bacterium]|jgi:CRP/FNR family transcriptional regulator
MSNNGNGQDEGLEWLSVFPELTQLDAVAKTKLKKFARIVEAPVGTIGYRETDPCNAYVMRLAGRSRVYKISGSGREILLYRVAAGETCVLTTTCLLGHSRYPASTVVEEPIRDVIIPATAFHDLMVESDVFRRFVLNNYGNLISDLIVLLEEVAFSSISARLAKLLLEIPDGALSATHQQIADELGSAREVVSRQLKEFERNGWVSLHRGAIMVTERTALQKLL